MRVTVFLSALVIAVALGLASSKRADRVYAKASASVVDQCKQAAKAHVDSVATQMEEKNARMINFKFGEAQRMCEDTGVDRLDLFVKAYGDEGFFLRCDPDEIGVTEPDATTGLPVRYFNVTVYAINPNLADAKVEPMCPIKKQPPVATETPSSQ